MKKSNERRRITYAFVYYARIFNGGVKHLTPFDIYNRIQGIAGSNTSLALDLWAVHETVLFLCAIEDFDTLRAVREIYLKPFLRHPSRTPVQKELTYRIQKYANESFVDERTVYRKLEKVRRLWYKLRIG